ncbi:MAG: hypothetical protein H6Q52_3279 [Deltaproteobacteria bacterium]|nr:hypothetical protein [Deltaproteobacteria bacterium]
MVHRTYISVIIVIVVLIFAVNSCSGPGKKDTPKRPPFIPETQFLSTMYDTKPFNINTDWLSPMYAGHNPELLYNNIRLRQEMVKRHPREAVEQYRTRVAENIYAPLMGSVDFDSVYAFRITPGNRVYNAGKKAVQLSFKLTPVYEKGLEIAKRAFVVRFQPQLDNSYVVTGENGSKRVIEEKKFSEYAIMPVDSAGAPVENRDTLAAAIVMTPQEAKKSEGDLMFLLIGRLESPYISYEEINRNPLPGTSGTYLARYHYLHVKIIDIWVYDVTSGKIIQRGFQASGLKFQEKEKEKSSSGIELNIAGRVHTCFNPLSTVQLNDDPI